MKIRELLSDESKWTQRAPAKTSLGRPVNSDNPEAVCWCIAGAARHCYGDTFETNEILRRVCNKLEISAFLGYIDWNDAPDRRFEEVKALVNALDI